MPRPKVFLFDIDGTLIATGGVGRRALERAFESLYGRPDACRAIRFDGMTDRRIARLALAAIGVPDTPENIQQAINTYVQILETTIREADPSGYRVHPGMREAVDAIARRDDVALGLGTGNVKAGAKLKLDKVALFDSFRFGGFGCDHEDRVELIRVGAQRGADFLGAPLNECDVLVIGDTPKDIDAARGIGARCLAVGTGSFTAAQLREAGAHWAFDSLSDPQAIDLLLSDA